MREPMQALSDSRTREVVVMSSAQVGKTELALNAIMYFIDQAPSPCLYIAPTLEMARDFSKTKLSAMLRDSIPGVVAEPRSRDSDTTALFKKFPGGFLALQGSNSPAGLASRSIRVLILDEISRYADTTIEGDPITLAMKRTATFTNSKVLAVSTPTHRGCRIEEMYQAGSRARYHVPCPHCGEMQTLNWNQLSFDKDNPDAATYTCVNGCIIEHHHKPRMVAAGKWVHENPDNTRTRSFQLSELLSPWVTWGDMVRAWLTAQSSPELLQVFINTSLGESFDTDQGHAIEWDQFLERRESFDVTSCPDDVLVITAGCDVQKDRIEVSLLGWGEDYECWVLDHRVIWGEPAQGYVWQELDDLLAEPIVTTDGRRLRVQCTAIDSGGHWTDDVYSFTRPRAAKKVFAIKGSNKPAQPIASRPTIVGRQRVPLYAVGTDTAKQWLFGRLPSDEPPSMIHFSERLDAEYFKQLTAEKMVETRRGGTARLTFKKTRGRNEALDCFVYALAAVNILSPRFAKIANRGNAKTDDIAPPEQPTVDQQLRPKRPRFRRSSWVTRY